MMMMMKETGPKGLVNLRKSILWEPSQKTWYFFETMYTAGILFRFRNRTKLTDQLTDFFGVTMQFLTKTILNKFFGNKSVFFFWNEPFNLRTERKETFK